MVANHTLSCCIQNCLPGNLNTIHNLTVLYDLVKPCFFPKDNFSNVISYIIRNQDEVTGCSKSKQTTHEQCKSNYKNIAVFTIFWVMVMIVATFGNMVVCIVIRKTRSLRMIITNHFIASLAVSDLMVAIFLVPVNIYSTIQNKSLCSNWRLCRYYMTTDNISFVASITNLFVITADRFIAITWPYRYNEIVTERRSKVVIVLVWVYAIAIGTFTNFNWDDLSSATDNAEDDCWKQNRIYITFVYAIVFYIPALMMACAQAKMMYVAMKQSKMILTTLKIGESFKESSEEEDSTVLQPKQLKTRIRRVLKEYKPVKAIVIVYGTFFLCWLPVSIISLVKAWSPRVVRLQPWQTAIFVHVLPILNSTFNFFIYSIMNRKFKKACKRLFLNMIQHFS
eukprot:gene15945-17548_t